MRGILFSALAIGAAAFPIDRNTFMASIGDGDRNPVWNETSNTPIDRPSRSEHERNKDDAWLFEMSPPIKDTMIKTVGFGGVTINELGRKVRGLLTLASTLLLTTCQEHHHTQARYARA
jgi:hypothetical protein